MYQSLLEEKLAEEAEESDEISEEDEVWLLIFNGEIFWCILDELARMCEHFAQLFIRIQCFNAGLSDLLSRISLFDTYVIDGGLCFRCQNFTLCQLWPHFG